MASHIIKDVYRMTDFKVFDCKCISAYRSSPIARLENDQLHKVFKCKDINSVLQAGVNLIFVIEEMMPYFGGHVKPSASATGPIRHLW